MSSENGITAAPVKEKRNPKPDRNKIDAYQRRYVGYGETAAYVVYDASQSISLDTGTYNTDVLHIDLKLMSLMNAINGVWDVINDTFTSVLVDRTRTRYGKFRVYLLAFAIPGAVFTLLYYHGSLFLNLNDEHDMVKWWFYMVLAILRETIATFQSISQNGILPSMTPNPDERVRLKSRASMISAIFDNLPGILMTLLYDLAYNGKINLDLESYYIAAGSIVTVITTGMAMYFFFVMKERVLQSEERPNIREGLRAIYNNKPMLIILLSELTGKLTSFSVKSYYYRDVLGYKTFDSIIQLPASPISVISYAFVPWARRRFTNKALWIFNSHYENVHNIIIFFFGIIGGTGADGNYNSFRKMMIFLMLLEIPRKLRWGLKILETEITNEALDYCEWKNGYRSEGVLLTAKSLFTKLVGNLFGSAQSLMLDAAGYDQKKSGFDQSQRTKFYIFAFSYIFPGVLGLVGIIPKLFYNITGDMRVKMYNELLESRSRILREATEKAE